MVRTYKNTLWLSYGLWLLSGLCIVGLGWSGFQSPLSPRIAVIRGSGQLIVDSLGRQRMLTYRSALSLKVVHEGLCIGSDTLPFMPDTVRKTVFWRPVSLVDWQQRFIEQVGEPGTDSAQRMKTALAQCQAFMKPQLDSLAKNPDWKKLPVALQLAHALFITLGEWPTGQVFTIEGSLLRLTGVTSVSAPSVDSVSLLTAPLPPTVFLENNRWLMVLGLLAMLAGIGLTYWRSRPEGNLAQVDYLVTDEGLPDTQPEPPGNSALEVENEAPAFAVPEPTNEKPPSVLDQYLTNFYVRYGDFYKFMQDIPIEPNDAETQQIKCRLVEMGLHAHSLARAYRHNPSLDHLTDEPNLLLILHQQQVGDLPPLLVKTFTNDPHKTAKNVQFLQQVLQSLDIGQLEGVLLQNIYVPPSFLKPA